MFDIWLFLYFSRFITMMIRNDLNYSPQTIYWLGGTIAPNKHLKWNDGSNVTYQVCVCMSGMLTNIFRLLDIVIVEYPIFVRLFDAR